MQSTASNPAAGEQCIGSVPCSGVPQSSCSVDSNTSTFRTLPTELSLPIRYFAIWLCFKYWNRLVVLTLFAEAVLFLTLFFVWCHLCQNVSITAGIRFLNFFSYELLGLQSWLNDASVFGQVLIEKKTTSQFFKKIWGRVGSECQFWLIFDSFL